MDWRNAFDAAGAIWTYPGRGPHAHHVLTDHHSAYYFNSQTVLDSADLTEHIFARAWGPRAVELNAELIVAPRTLVSTAEGLASAFARTVGLPFVAIDVPSGTAVGDVPTAKRALIVTDDVHGGGSAAATIRAIRDRGANVAGLLTLTNFSDLIELEGVRIEALAHDAFAKWRPGECPLCATGSIAIDARREWNVLQIQALRLGRDYCSTHRRGVAVLQY